MIKSCNHICLHWTLPSSPLWIRLVLSWWVSVSVAFLKKKAVCSMKPSLNQWRTDAIKIQSNEHFVILHRWRLDLLSLHFVVLPSVPGHFAGMLSVLMPCKCQMGAVMSLLSKLSVKTPFTFTMNSLSANLWYKSSVTNWVLLRTQSI